MLETTDHLTAAQLVEMIRPKRRSIKRMSSIRSQVASDNDSSALSAAGKFQRSSSVLSANYHNATANSLNPTNPSRLSLTSTTALQPAGSLKPSATCSNFDTFTAKNSNLNLSVLTQNSTLSRNFTFGQAQLQHSRNVSSYRNDKRSSLAMPRERSTFKQFQKSERRSTQDIGSLSSSQSFPEKMSLTLQDRLRQLTIGTQIEETSPRLPPRTLKLTQFNQIKSRFESNSSPTAQPPKPNYIVTKKVASPNSDLKYDKSERSVGSESQYFSFDGSFNEESRSFKKPKDLPAKVSPKKFLLKETRPKNEILALSISPSNYFRRPVEERVKEAEGESHSRSSSASSELHQAEREAGENREIRAERSERISLEEQQPNHDKVDDENDISEASFFKNGGISQYGSGMNLSANMSTIQNQLNKLTVKYSAGTGLSGGSGSSLFAAALLKAEKQRRIQSWVDQIVVEN